MNANHLRLALAWIVSAAAACTSAPIRYYTLIPPPDKPLQAAKATLAIEVRVVHIPPELNRSELMVRTGPSETALLDNERWASPMKDEIKDAVHLELQRRMGGTSALPPINLALDIDVQRLEAQLGRYALLEASWSANLSGAGQSRSGARVTICTFRAEEAIHDGYAGMVEGYQREIAALADAIVARLTSSAIGIDASCETPSENSAGGSGAEGR